MVDGTHFRLGQATPEDVGWRALAGALSDVAAMGAEPGEAYLSVVLPPDLDEDGRGRRASRRRGAGGRVRRHDRRRRPRARAGADARGDRGRVGRRAGGPRRPRRRAGRRPRRRDRDARGRRRGSGDPRRPAVGPRELVARYLRPRPRLDGGPAVRAAPARPRCSTSPTVSPPTRGGWPRRAASGSCSTRRAPAGAGVEAVATIARRRVRPRRARRDRRRGLRTARVRARRARRGVTWIGVVEAGAGLQWRGAPPGAEAWQGYLH